MAKKSSGTDIRLAWIAAIAVIVVIIIWFRVSWGDDGRSSYWYCWNSGSSSPHHFGHHVGGDHHCTQKELEQSGF